MNLQQTFREKLKSMNIHGCTVLCAVSGGCDSVSLLHLIASCRMDLDLHPVVVHMNHNLRGSESDADEKFVSDLAASYGMTFVTERCDVLALVDSMSMSIEEAARHLRYKFFERVAEDLGAQLVLTAHTMDDQAETFLLQLARGSGLHGLSAMPALRALPSGVLLARPLLGIQRCELETVGHQEGWTWRHDSSNDDPSFLRNALRLHVMPVLRKYLGESITQSISKSTELLQDSRKIVDHLVSEHVAKITEVNENQFEHVTTINIQCLVAMSSEIQNEVIRSILRPHLGVPPERLAVGRILSMLTSEVGSRYSIKSTTVAIRERNHIAIVSTKDAMLYDDVIIDHDGQYVYGDLVLDVKTVAAGDVELDRDRSIAYIDSSSVNGPIRWRTWKPGERMKPFGSKSNVLISDLLTNAKIDSRTRSRKTVLSDSNGIIWLCGIRLNDDNKIHSKTEQIKVFKILNP